MKSDEINRKGIMLVEAHEILRGNPILKMVAMLSRCDYFAKSVSPGVYEIDHFGMTGFPGPNYESYPDLGKFDACGVCDNWEQIVQQCPVLNAPDRIFAITITKIEKRNQPSGGGWRWRKWGPYIGTKTPMCEYLYDEQDIDSVCVFHVYEKTK